MTRCSPGCCSGWPSAARWRASGSASPLRPRGATRGGGGGARIGVAASTMEANAALRAIVRRDTGEGYRDMLTRMAEESGIETPTTEDLIRLDRRHKGKRLSNAEWESPTDPDARIAKPKDRRPRPAH